MIYFGKLYPFLLSPKHGYGGLAPANDSGEGENQEQPVVEPALPSEDPAEDPGPAEPVEEPVVVEKEKKETRTKTSKT